MKKITVISRNLLGILALGIGLSGAPTVKASSDPFIAEIIMFGGNFNPRGWALCDGQILAISDHSALFSILGTTYGGDGRTTFALPDLRGRGAVHPGAGPGFSPIRLGERGGAEKYKLTVAQMPSHSHTASTTATLNGINAAGTSASPGGNSLASKSRTNIYSAAAPNVAMVAGSVTAETTVTSSGGGLSFSIRDPYLGINYIIALVGTFPPRN